MSEAAFLFLYSLSLFFTIHNTASPITPRLLQATAACFRRSHMPLSLFFHRRVVRPRSFTYSPLPRLHRLSRSAKCRCPRQAHLLALATNTFLLLHSPWGGWHPS